MAVVQAIREMVGVGEGVFPSGRMLSQEEPPQAQCHLQHIPTSDRFLTRDSVRVTGNLVLPPASGGILTVTGRPLFLPVREFPMAVVSSCHKLSGTKQHKFIDLQFWRPHV